MLGKKLSGAENLKRKLAKQAEKDKLSGSLQKFLKTNQVNMPNYETDIQYPSTSSTASNILQHQKQE
jgi:hypothetical protein